MEGAGRPGFPHYLGDHRKKWSSNYQVTTATANFTENASFTLHVCFPLLLPLTHGTLQHKSCQNPSFIFVIRLHSLFVLPKTLHSTSFLPCKIHCLLNTWTFTSPSHRPLSEANELHGIPVPCLPCSQTFPALTCKIVSSRHLFSWHKLSCEQPYRILSLTYNVNSVEFQLLLQCIQGCWKGILARWHFYILFHIIRKGQPQLPKVFCSHFHWPKRKFITFLSQIIYIKQNISGLKKSLYIEATGQ